MEKFTSNVNLVSFFIIKKHCKGHLNGLQAKRELQLNCIKLVRLQFTMKRHDESRRVTFYDIPVAKVQHKINLKMYFCAKQ